MPLMIRNLLHSAPFAPFTIHVAEGRSLKTRHPDFATLTQGGRLLFVNTGGDDFEIIDLVSRVESTEPETAQTPSAS